MCLQQTMLRTFDKRRDSQGFKINLAFPSMIPAIHVADENLTNVRYEEFLAFEAPGCGFDLG